MIIFNTIKKAEHYVKWCNKTKDYSNSGYDYNGLETRIDGEYVIENLTIDATSSPTESGIYISNHMM